MLIRFIDEKYKDLFKIEDGARIQVQTPCETLLLKCKYIDPYHFQIANTVYHICEFAEMVSRNHYHISPEVESGSDEKAWSVVYGKEYLHILKVYNGWKYTIYNGEMEVVASGKIDEESLSIENVREKVLDDRENSGYQLIEIELDKLENVIHAEYSDMMDQIQSGY